MSRVVTVRELDDEMVASRLRPRDGIVLERDAGDGVFELLEGPMHSYRRTVDVEPLGGGQSRVTETVDYHTAIPVWGPLFALGFRRELARDGRGAWWSPPQRLDAAAAATLGALAVLAIVTGYTSTLMTQTITFIADEFEVGKSAQGVALAAVRLDVLLCLPLVAMADRKGRRPLLLGATTAACVLSALAALAPSLVVLTASQVVARGFVTAVYVLLGVAAAEEMPAGSRAYALGLLVMAGALGAGFALMLLPVADTAVWGWRVLFAASLLGLPLVRVAARHLVETRRFRAEHPVATMAGHGGRFWLLAAAAALLALFSIPLSQFQNEYLRDERGFSAIQITIFTICTATPGVIGIIIGGRLADTRGRRGVGAVALTFGTLAGLAMYLSDGGLLWVAAVLNAILISATVPALHIYSSELFPTSLRGRASGLITSIARLGSVTGLLTAGYLADRWGRLGPAMAVLAIGPAIVVLLVLTVYPETAGHELEELNPEDWPVV